MSLKRFTVLTVAACLFIGCTGEAPFDPATWFSGVDNVVSEARDAAEDALADPLRSKPFPVIVGGDQQRVFYATNLGDIRITFPGPSNDLVIPGFQGPSNLYKYEQKHRDLIRPLVPGGTVFGMATDGRYLAFGSAAQGGFSLTPEFESFSIVVTDIDWATQRIIYDEASSEGFIQWSWQRTLKVANGRLGFVIVDGFPGAARLRIEDLTDIDPTLEIQAEAFIAFDLRDDRVAFATRDDLDTTTIRLRNLSTDEETVIVDSASRVTVGNLFLTENLVVWSQWGEDDVIRVYAYDIRDQSTFLWIDGVVGELAGADDGHFITEEYFSENNSTRIRVWRYDLDGKRRKLAGFRADGLAGQARVLGDRAAWVNPDRKIVLAPLAGGDRIIFKPF